MNRYSKYTNVLFPGAVITDLTDCYTCSFTEFLPFCKQLFYFSNYKDFQQLTPAAK